MSDDDTTPSEAVASQVRTVKFAQPIVAYEQDVDDLLEVSSSESESDRELLSISAPLSGTLQDSVVSAKSTYLERHDFKALLESLRYSDQHDTAKHLLVTSLIRRMDSDKLREITCRKLRPGWSAWPIPPDQTKHSLLAEETLREELTSSIHRDITSQLRADGRPVSADDLPAAISSVMVENMLHKLTTLLENIHSARTYQGGLASSTSKRLRLLGHEHIMSLVQISGLVSGQAIQRSLNRCKILFGDAELLPDIPFDSREDMTRTELAQEIAAGAGSFRMRGSKRRRLEQGSTETADMTARGNGDLEDSMVGNRGTKTVEITQDKGKRFSKDVQPIPLHMLMQEEEDMVDSLSIDSP